MDDTKIVMLPIKARATDSSLVDRPFDVRKLDDRTLVVMFTDCAIEMKKRCHGMTGLSVHDEQGRVWSMPALMRYLNQVFNYVTIAFGQGKIR